MTKRNYKVDIDEAIDRAMLCLDMAYFGKNLDGTPVDEKIPAELRAVRSNVAVGYVELVKVLQTERDWEQQQVDRITKGGGIDATL